MKPGGSKSKGSAFERHVCKELSLWLSDGNRDDLLWRSSMSGGRHTIAMKGGKRRDAVAGDIVSLSDSKDDLYSRRAADFIGSHVVECKHLKNLGLDRFLLEFQGPIQAAFMQCKDAIGDSNRIPFLVLKQNRKPIIVVSSPTIPPMLPGTENLWFGSSRNLVPSVRQDKEGVGASDMVCVCLFEHFLSVAEPYPPE